jgi:hypothetical protein
MKTLALFLIAAISSISFAQEKLGDLRNGLWSLEKMTESIQDPITAEKNDVTLISLGGKDLTPDLQGYIALFRLSTKEEVNRLINTLNEVISLVGSNDAKDWELSLKHSAPCKISISKKSNIIGFATIYNFTSEGESKLEASFNKTDIEQLINLLEDNKNILP